MANVVAIFLGAGTGGVLRYAISLLVARGHHGAFPLATFLINVFGCLLIGFLSALFANVVPVRESYRLGILVGVLGGFTTFSSFGRETFELLGQQKFFIAISYVLASNLFGLLMVWAGYALARQMSPAAGS